MEAPYMLWLVYVSLASCVLYKFFVVGKKDSRLPPGPTPIPLLGNIFDIQGDLHQALTRLAGVHGPIISIKLGATTAVVASSAACARDVLQKYDHLLAARSVADAARALDHHERSIIWLPSTSPLWKRLRAVCTTHLFSAHALDAARAVREEKVRGLVGCIRGHAGETVEVGRVVLSGLFNIVSSVLFSEEGRRRRTVERLMRFFDFFDPIIERRMKAGGEGQGDFLDVLLQLHSVDQLSIQTIKSFLLDLFIAGTETNALSVEWTMAELIRNPAVMSKVRAELQEVLGAKQYPDESDINKLPYLRAVLMETMRLHPPSPLLIPHQVMAEGAEVGGFVVPKGAMVIVNLWAVMRDPASWTQPEAFLPERFVGADMDFRGKDRFEFMPFGAGRRACPGLPMATRVVMLILASLIHMFEWRLPEGMQPCDVDVRDRYRMSLNMVTPLKAVPMPLFS
ncbi:cytochrome P450 76M5-like isoform X2 [Hordeum vulgare subsp. vulgare]|uniref:cytochrome P450 76M5-like isoform X2 n=1 Tax=Hordeum vulgare subsp. vulgare TaxID=112509 RepID=UPI001D1A4EB1|nr:cytochrome P450 76M5-like isoform X2 [Hordeum vulgare subsp. vulgare]